MALLSTLSISNRIIRQTRFPTEHLSLKVDGQTWRIRNYSSFGISLFDKVNIHSNLLTASCTIDDDQIANVKLKVVRSEPCTAFEIVGDPLNTDEIQGIEQGYRIIREHKTTKVKYSSVPNEFKVLVYDLKEFLQNLKTSLDSIEFAGGERDLTFSAERYLSKMLPELYHRAAELVEPLSDSEKMACSRFFRYQLHMLYDSPFVARTLEKPRGYAGDHEMMHMIYENKFDGKTLFGRCLNGVFLDIGATRAVRNRAFYLVSKLTQLFESRKEKLRILSLASGPAKEIEYLIEHWQDTQRPIETLTQAEFYFLDQDEEALMRSQARLVAAARKHNLNTNFNFLNLSVRDVISNKLKNLGVFDFVYTAGLFDYLEDRVAQATAGALFEVLNKNGQLVIGNFDKTNPDRLMMEFVMDWPLIYRDAVDLRRLFSHLANPVIESEPEKINLFSCLRKGD